MSISSYFSNISSAAYNAASRASTAAFNASKTAASTVSTAAYNAASSASTAVVNASKSAASSASTAAYNTASRASTAVVNASKSAASSASTAVTSRLPQNEHVKKAEGLKNQIVILQQALGDKASAAFQQKLAETINYEKNEKTKCIEALTKLNGAYYQDPDSELKKGWDNLVKAVRDAGLNVERLDQLEEITKKLESSTNEKAATAQNKIISYQTLNETRNQWQRQLTKILGEEKAESAALENQLKVKKEQLQQRHRELCGNYFGDSRGKLDQAWQKYQTEGTEIALNAYKALETERKKTEAELWEIDQELTISVSADRTFEVLTTNKIQAELVKLDELQKREANLSGVDLTKLFV
jgi:hypothetical protein